MRIEEVVHYAKDAQREECSQVVRVQGDDYWEAVEAEPERSHHRTQADLLGGGNTWTDGNDSLPSAGTMA